jgi:hypothetical protein
VGDGIGVREAVKRLIGLGLVTADLVALRLTAEELDETLDYYGDSAAEGAVGLLGALGMTYDIDYKTLRHACAEGIPAYEEELGYVAAASRGLLTITDVTLVDDDNGHHLLRFRCNTVPHQWKIIHEDKEHMNAQTTFAMGVDDLLAGGSPARWCQPDPLPYGFIYYSAFADPDLLNEYGEPYGLTFEA